MAAAAFAAAWALSLSQGSTAGGAIHLLAILAVFALVAQARLRTHATKFELWQVKHHARDR